MAPSTTGERESPTPSQLDILAERNERLATPSPFARTAFVLALVGVLLLLGAVLWWFVQRGDPAALGAVTNATTVSATTATKAESAATAAAVAPDPAASRPVVTATGASDGPAPDVLPAVVVAPAAAPSAVPAQAQASVPAPSTAERARKALARREADARAKASPAPAQRQQRDVDKERDQTAAAAEKRGGAGPSASGAEIAPRLRAEGAAPGVRELCATRNNIVSELFCRSRECRKPEHAKDATCVGLKEIEDAQRRVDQQ